MISAPHSDNPAPIQPPHGLEYFYAPPSAVTADTVYIDGDEFAHLTHVMRRREGDVVGVIDGQGMAYVVGITVVQKDRAIGSIRSTHPLLHEHSTPVILAAAILKNPSRFDTLIEKVTEVGIRSVVPLFTERTIPRHARTERWQKLALAAAKQCGRSIIPHIHAPMPIAAYLQESTLHGDRRWILHEEATEEMPPGNTDNPQQMHSLMIGPEGGFTGAEVSLAAEHGYCAVSLGTRRLRSETAAIAAAVRVLM